MAAAWLAALIVISIGSSGVEYWSDYLPVCWYTGVTTAAIDGLEWQASLHLSFIAFLTGLSSVWFLGTWLYSVFQVRSGRRQSEGRHPHREGAFIRWVDVVNRRASEASTQLWHQLC